MGQLTLHYTFSDQAEEARIEHPLVTLLRAVRDQGSILAAAKQRQLSYRYCWGELKRWEKELSVSLVIWGRTSKGVALTPQALAFLDAEEQVQKKFSNQISQIKAHLNQSVRLLMRQAAPQTDQTASQAVLVAA
jgi:molybdate transport repressor ModE-like protein